MKLIIKPLFCCFSLFLITGCWDRTEVNDLAFVTATGIDKIEENKFQVSVQIPLPSALGGAGSSGGGGGTTGGPSYVDSEIGRNAREGVDNLQKRMSRQLYSGHRRVLILGEKLAREGVENSLNFILEQPQSRLSTFVVVTDGKAVDILTASPHLEKISSEAIREIVKAGMGITVKDVLHDIGTPGKDPILPVVQTIKTKNGNDKDKKEELEVNGVALLKGSKVSFFANKEETLGALWLLNEMEQRNYTFAITKKKELSILINKLKVKPTYKVINGIPSFTIEINTNANIIQNEPQLNLADEAIFEEATKALEKQIKKEADAILQHSLKEGIDFLGLGQQLNLHDHARWKKEWSENWRELLKDLNVNVRVSANLEHLINTEFDMEE